MASGNTHRPAGCLIAIVVAPSLNSNKISHERQGEDRQSDYRGSNYRGPSKNRNKWQVMKMIKKKLIRVGGIPTELEAAKVNDFIAIMT